LQTITKTPSAAVKFHNRGKGPGAARPEQTGEQRRIAVAEIFDIFDVELVFKSLWCSSCHSGLLL
jgi:hypothetical protein